MNITRLVRTIGDRDNFAHRPFQYVLAFDGINDVLLAEGSSGLAKDLYDNFNSGTKFTISFWVNPLTNSGWSSLLFNLIRTPRTFLTGHWNEWHNGGTETAFAGKNSTFGRWGLQKVLQPSPNPVQNLYKRYTFNKINTLTHCLWTYDNTLPLSERITVYINGNKSFVEASSNDNLTAPISSTNYIFCIGAWSYSTTVIHYIPCHMTELVMVKNYIPTDEEVRRIFNLGKNGYSVNILNNRFLHLPLGSPSDFQVVGGQLQAIDISGNNRNVNLFGQGTTPALVSAY